MGSSLYWLQCGGCSGDTWSLFGSETPDVVELLELLEIEVLWHPSLSVASPVEHRRILQRIVDGELELDLLCVEGAIIRGPGGTGMFDTFHGHPKKDLVSKLANRAGTVLAMGTCASFGGVPATGEIEATGLQFHRKVTGGFLGENFRSRSGLPVINLPGCPCHGEVMSGVLTALVTGGQLVLTANNVPEQWYGMLVHQGCVRNEYHEFRVEEHDFGEKGCLFFHMGCQAPMTYGVCNKVLWNRRNSKTSAGVPCLGCTRPDFPREHPFFKSESIAGVPLKLPIGVDRAHYLAYKGLAAAAAPQRLLRRETRV